MLSKVLNNFPTRLTLNALGGFHISMIISNFVEKFDNIIIDINFIWYFGSQIY